MNSIKYTEHFAETNAKWQLFSWEVLVSAKLMVLCIFFFHHPPNKWFSSRLYCLTYDARYIKLDMVKIGQNVYGVFIHSMSMPLLSMRYIMFMPCMRLQFSHSLPLPLNLILSRITKFKALKWYWLFIMRIYRTIENRDEYSCTRTYSSTAQCAPKEARRGERARKSKDVASS